MFFKNETQNKIACVFDPKIDHTAKIKKEYEPNLESYVYNLSTIAEKVEINFKIKDSNKCEMPNFVILQLFLTANKHFSLEISLCDRINNTKRRLFLSSLNMNMIPEEKNNVLLLPMKKIKRNAWINLNLDLYQVMEKHFGIDPQANNLNIEQILISSYCKVRKVVFSDICLEIIGKMNMIEYGNKMKKINESKLFYLNEILTCHSKFTFCNENIFSENVSPSLKTETFDFMKKIHENDEKIIKKNNENNQNCNNIILTVNNKPKKKTLEKSMTLQNIRLRPNNKPNLINIEKEKKCEEKLPHIKILKEKLTKRPLSTQKKAKFHNSPLKTSDFEKKAQKFNSIMITTDIRTENPIAESINFNTSQDKTSEKYDDSSVETVQSVDYSNGDLDNKKDCVEETYENEFFEKKIDKKSVNFEKMKMFKNSSLITMKNNAKVVLERKDNLENKGFINEIEKMTNFNLKEVMFDPILKSFYDPKTQTYYHKI